MCFPTCRLKNRGHPIKQVKTNVWKKWRGISYEQVDHYVCPCCGATETSVVTNGTSVSRQRHATLAAL